MPFKSKAEARDFLRSKGLTDEQIDAGIARRQGGAKAAAPDPTIAAPDATTGESIAKDVGSIAGEIGGGIIGATRGHPHVGATVGAGVGRAGVGAVQDAPEFMEGDLTGKDLIWRAGQEFARGSGESIVSTAALKTMRWIAAPVVNAVSPEAKEFIQYMHSKLIDLPSGSWSDPVSVLRHPVNTIRKAIFGVTKPAAATPDVLTENFLLDMGGNIARTTMFGGGSVRALDVRNTRILGEAAEDLGRKFGQALPRDKFGQAVEAAIKDRISGAELARQTAKNTVNQLSPQTVVDMTSVVGPIKKKARLGKRMAADPMKPIGLVDDFEQSMLDKLGPNPPLDAVMEFRDVLRVKGHKELVPALDKAISKSLGKNKQSLKAFRDYQDLEKMTKSSEGALNTKFINGVLSQIKGRGGYEAIADMLKPNNVTTVRRLREGMDVSFPGSSALGNPWKHVQAEFNQRLLDGATMTTEKGVKEVRGARLYATLQAPETQELITEIYGKDHLKNLTSFARNLLTAQAKGIAGGRGKFSVETKEGGLMNKVTGGLLETLGLGVGAGTAMSGSGLLDVADAGAAAVIALPTLLGRAFTDPVIVKWLSEGLAHPRLFGKTRMASAASARLLRAEAEEIFLDDSSMGDYERQFTQQKSPYPAGMMP